MAEQRDCCPACGQSLAADDEGFVDKLITALRHPEPTRASLAILVLSEMLVEPRAVLPLIDLLAVAHDAAVLRDAVVALGRFADRRAAPAIGRLLLDLESPLVVRVAAVEALVSIGGETARAALERAVSDPNAMVRECAEKGNRLLRIEEEPDDKAV